MVPGVPRRARNFPGGDDDHHNASRRSAVSRSVNRWQCDVVGYGIFSCSYQPSVSLGTRCTARPSWASSSSTHNPMWGNSSSYCTSATCLFLAAFGIGPSCSPPFAEHRTALPCAVSKVDTDWRLSWRRDGGGSPYRNEPRSRHSVYPRNSGAAMSDEIRDVADDEHDGLGATALAVGSRSRRKSTD